MATSDDQIQAESSINPSTYNQEADSAFDEEVASYTTSLATGITDYKFEHGRRYHAYKEGSYPYPNDEKEKDRLDIMHKLIEIRMDGKLHWAPISKNPSRILDIGTGTGIWAIEIGDEFPMADVLGNDLSPIQPRWVPPNVRFEVDDVEADWTYSQKFDYIHARCMGTAIKNWPRLVKQCFEFTKPGAYTEFVDLDLQWTSLDGSMKDDSASWKFISQFLKASNDWGIEPCAGPTLEGLVKEQGFEDVFHQRLPLPLGTWPADKKLKEIGAWNYLQISEGLEGFMYSLFTKHYGYAKEEVEVLCAQIRKEIKNPQIHILFYLHVCYGKKPEDK